jgi:hypothetical protein
MEVTDVLADAVFAKINSSTESPSLGIGSNIGALLY